MTSTLQEIADTLTVEFRNAVIDAEAEDRMSIEKITQDLNLAFHEYEVRDGVLQTQAEQALRTLSEIYKLRDVNSTTYKRRVEALRVQLAEFRETKIAAKVEEPTGDNVVRLEKA